MPRGDILPDSVRTRNNRMPSWELLCVQWIIRGDWYLSRRKVFGRFFLRMYHLSLENILRNSGSDRIYPLSRRELLCVQRIDRGDCLPRRKVLGRFFHFLFRLSRRYIFYASGSAVHQLRSGESIEKRWRIGVRGHITTDHSTDPAADPTPFSGTKPFTDPRLSSRDYFVDS